MDRETFAVFIDESGNEDLDVSKEGATAYFVSLAIIVPESKCQDLRSHITNVEKTSCGEKGLKSSDIGSNWVRRLKLIQDLTDFAFEYVSVVIDKGEIAQQSGLQYKRSFRKYLLRMLYERIRASGRDFRILIDQHGGGDFQQEFNKYMGVHFPNNLFQEFSTGFEDDANEPALRLADFLAGTWRLILENPSVQQASQIRALLRKQEIDVYLWPPRSALLPIGASAVSKDSMIRDHSIRVASEYITSVGHESSDLDRYRATFLRNIVYETFENLQSDAVISTRLLEARMQRAGFGKKSIQWLQRNVVGYLRDYGVLLAGTRDGVRLVSNSRDLDAYVHHVCLIVLPMLRRLRVARATVKNITSNEIDILDADRSGNLRSALESYEDSTLGLN